MEVEETFGDVVLLLLALDDVGVLGQFDGLCRLMGGGEVDAVLAQPLVQRGDERELRVFGEVGRLRPPLQHRLEPLLQRRPSAPGHQSTHLRLKVTGRHLQVEGFPAIVHARVQQLKFSKFNQIVTFLKLKFFVSVFLRYKMTSLFSESLLSVDKIKGKRFYRKKTG